MSEAIRDPADSAVQRELEPAVLERLAAELGGLRLERNRALAVGEGRTVKPDGWITRPNARRERCLQTRTGRGTSIRATPC